MDGVKLPPPMVCPPSGTASFPALWEMLTMLLNSRIWRPQLRHDLAWRLIICKKKYEWCSPSSLMRAADQCCVCR